VTAPIHILQAAKSTGGVGVYTRRLIQALDKQRYQITAICLAAGSDELAAELSRLPNVSAFSIPMKDSIDPFSDLHVYARIARIVRDSRPGLIHAHTSKPGFLTRLAAVGTGIPVIYQPANFAFHDGTPRLLALGYASLEGLMARFATERIIAVCQGERELARRYSVGTDDMFTIIHSGIEVGDFNLDVDRVRVRSGFGIPPDARLVGSVARLTEAKAPQDFIRSAAIVHDRNPSVHFLWVGDGPLEPAARALVAAKGLQDVFHFAGHRNDIPAVLQALDCFVLSSHWEGFSIAMLEAMAAGLPIVCTRVMGAAEAICDNETGYLVAIGDVPSMAEAVLRLCGDPVLSRRMGLAAQTRAYEKFTYSGMLTRIDALYQEVYAKYRR
jgi:glycosyltransferase involved in cell wall biosynthesis